MKRRTALKAVAAIIGDTGFCLRANDGRRR
jgi:hypothetical protein